jgi:hypothetical protein
MVLGEDVVFLDNAPEWQVVRDGIAGRLRMRKDLKMKRSN